MELIPNIPLFQCSIIHLESTAFLLFFQAKIGPLSFHEAILYIISISYDIFGIVSILFLPALSKHMLLK